MAASWGCFDLRHRKFMTSELEKAGVDVSYLPQVLRGYAMIGTTRDDVPVVCSMGDNQAAVRGSLKDEANSLLVNIGTGSQVSFVSNDYVEVAGDVELRPYGDVYILAGAALCGGRAYAMLEKLFREIAGHECYGLMSEKAEEFLAGGEAGLKVDTRFAGTRSDPEIRGSISGIGEENFCVGALSVGVMRGILGELHGMYETMTALTGRRAKILVGSGNGMRKNVLMQRLAGEMFGMSVEIPAFTEEAACGCAMCASDLMVRG
jgi:sedoheptulokinase